MKNKITQLLNLLMLLLSINLFSQQIFTDESRIIKIDSKLENSKLSLVTKSILLQAKQNKNNSITEVNLNSLLRITLLFDGDCTNFNRSNIFLDISKISDNISTAFIKVQDLPLLESIQCLKYADIGEKLELEVSNARNTTNTNSVHSGTGLSQSYTGTGVIVGIIDGGFDYTHPNFKDVNGNLRISRVWERSNASGTPPSNLGFTYGSEYIGATAILSKLYDLTNSSHGTHVAGIAAGTGTGNLSLLKGMAPNSEIVLVSGFNQVIPTDNNYVDAINYIKNYANSVNKPVVINMSFGTGLGPHDGTTLEEQALNNLSNTPGLVLVAAAGNDGGRKKHAVNVFNGNQTKFLLNNKNFYSANEESTIDIWGNNQGINSAFGVTIGVYNTLTETYESTSTLQFIVNGNLNFQNPYTLIDVDPIFTSDDLWTITFFSEINPLNNRPHLRITCNSNNDNASDFLIVAIQSIDDTIHSWCNNCEFDNLTGFNFTQGDDFFSIYSPGNASGVVTVGSYNPIEVLNSEPFPGDEGTLSTYSCKGPRTDFLIKPNVTAPGNRIVSSLSSFDANYQTGGQIFSDVTNPFGTHSYGKMQGTSMAAPVVTGIVALWLQAFPQLTTNNVKSIIANTAITQSPVSDPFLFYGTTYSTPPNVKWGYGKINALAGMQLIEQALNVDTFDTTNNFIVYPNPTSSKIFITSKEYVSSYEIYNTLGQKVKEGSFNAVLEQEELDLTALQNGLYILNFKGEKVNKIVRIVKQ
jgi:subtilisin family serine protease